MMLATLSGTALPGPATVPSAGSTPAAVGQAAVPERAAVDDDRERAYDQALRLYRDGRIAEALDTIEQAISGSGETAALRTLAGWCRLRGGAVKEAESEFRAALVLDPAAVEPQVGLGYVLLRRGVPRRAAEEFSLVIRREAGNADALKGLGLALRDQKKYAAAADAFRAAIRTAPGDREAEALLDQVLAAGGGSPEIRPRPAADPSAPVRVVARAGRRRFEVADGAGFRSIFVKGVNFGVALPGRFPAEFPEEKATYAEWLLAVSDMGANVVRLYTLLPPAFYEALADHNRTRPAARLWLVQGAWTELPEDGDYDGPLFLGGFRDEIRRVVDALHGNLDLPARPGHAYGRYRADVSGSLLAILLGREWEPFSVVAYEKRLAGRPMAPFRGDFLAADPAKGATPFEIWLARVVDFTVGYETSRYRQQRPVSFVNWPTLDPIPHPTEATVAEEREMLRQKGQPLAAQRIMEYDNDAVGVDASHLVPTAENRGGMFAAYHAYPYYPDFMNLDPGYLKARDSIGPSNYIGYLRDLRRHHGDLPILIAETGVPSSRGIAHLQPQGWHHGGHTERAQGEIDARLMRDIDEADLAGGILFALIDEWFKRNWLVTEFEAPYERNPLWLNILDPEQNYGVLAARPGAGGWKVTIDGRGSDWEGIAPIFAKAGGPARPFGDGHDAARTLRSLAVTSDEAYLYVRLEVGRLDADGDGAPDWNEAHYLIGIDTYDTRRGDHRLPVSEPVRSPVGLEFCLVFDGQESARFLVDPPYDVETHRYRRPYGSAENDDGRFMEIVVETNRRRLGRDGTVFPAQSVNRSALRHGSTERRDPDWNSLADWHVGRDGEFLEARIGWGLLNVTDPSSRRVLHDDPADLREIGTVETRGFRFFAAAIKPNGPAGAETPVPGRLADRLPARAAPSPADFPAYAWPGWERPAYRIEKKEAWTILRKAFMDLPASGGER